MIWVRLDNNKVMEIIPEENTIPDVASWYGAEFESWCIQAPDEVQQNWYYNPQTEEFTQENPCPPIENNVPNNNEWVCWNELINAIQEGVDSSI